MQLHGHCNARSPQSQACEGLVHVLHVLCMSTCATNKERHQLHQFWRLSPSLPLTAVMHLPPCRPWRCT